MTEKILIVEDNLINRKVIRAALEPHGYTLIEAIDGEEALEVATSRRPDLIIMDIQLPKVSGLEVVKRLRQMPDFSSIPILAVTAYAMRGDKERFIKAGCDAYLPKPINTRELPRVVAEMLVGRDKGST